MAPHFFAFNFVVCVSVRVRVRAIRCGTSNGTAEIESIFMNKRKTEQKKSITMRIRIHRTPKTT